jgi:putative tryptophan/tyrosine transport system substrate-binding protein
MRYASPVLIGARIDLSRLKRRDFIALLGSVAAWPLVARAQQQAMPVIGFLHLTSRDETRGYLPDFHKGLADAGYLEGKSVAIEYRWGQGHNDRLPSLIAELVQRQVSAIVTLVFCHKHLNPGSTRI